MLKIGDTVTFYDPGSRREHESWQRGIIRQTIARDRKGRHAVHVVALNAHKWDRDSPWGSYDGVPEVLGRETNGSPELEWIDTWPRRHNKERIDPMNRQQPQQVLQLVLADFQNPGPAARRIQQLRDEIVESAATHMALTAAPGQTIDMAQVREAIRSQAVVWIMAIVGYLDELAKAEEKVAQPKQPTDSGSNTR
jgi:hypothetical protein